MNRAYWEKIAPGYNEEIFDVLKNDSRGHIISAIRKFSSPRKSVIDIGCAIGKWLPVLSPVFKKVTAIDISVQNLDIAKKLYPGLTNVVYERIDMSSPRIKVGKHDLAICINAILTDFVKKRTVFFHNLGKCIKKNGHIILVVPSLESWLLTSIIRQRWNPDKDAHEFIRNGKSKLQFKNILQGHAEIDNVATKHYLREEIQLLLHNEKFETLAIKKIEYEWTTEFLKPLKWLKDPRPWDWMVVARKL